MFVGTGSDVGKSWIVAGVCRWLRNKKYQPAPFKAQNMSLNSYATPSGHEIGRAQAVQAEACGISCSYHMNPVLLKPSSVNKSQVVLNGMPIGSQTAKEYFLGEDKKHLFEEAKKGFNYLNENFSPVVMEGAGSISELNLKHRDIVNMRMAEAANACVYLIADIDRGGVFASVYGSIELLEDWERALVKGIIINKFRGDATLFEDGKLMLEKLTGLPVIGVVPFAKDIHLEEEDSVALSIRNKVPVEGKVNIAVVHLNYMSNYTDFQPFEYQEEVNLFYTRNPRDLKRADVLIIPGTKNTIGDLESLKEDGIDKVILSEVGKKPIIGICGGYQMMGSEISDPFQVESNLGSISGLGIFEGKTILSKEKHSVQTKFKFKNHAEECQGYEIHMGETEIYEDSALNLIEGKPEGFFDGEKCWGSYIHGIFENNVIFQDLFKSINVELATQESYKEAKERNYNLLGNHIDNHLDMNAIIKDIEAC